MARTRPDTGAISLSGLLKLSAVVFLVCLLFLIVDVRHRVTGYKAVYGQGIQGTVTVTECGSHRFGRFCTGDFTSADGRVKRSEIRVNGGLQLVERARNGVRPALPAQFPAALSGAKADEAWTLDGKPWMRPSKAQVIALVPVAAPVIALWVFVRRGASGRRLRTNRARAIRTKRTVRRERNQVRRGRVH